MFSFLTHNLIWTESFWIVILLAFIAAVGWFFFTPLLYLSFILFAFCFYFFRNPDRVCPEALNDPNVIVCPADGKIVDIQSLDGKNGYHTKISIFLSPLDVHVNWTPIAGNVEKVEYVPGKFMMAFLPKSSELNEHNDVIIRNQNGQTVLVRQIAGTVARRIVCWISRGESVQVGQKYGMIKFSSRIDLFLPHDVVVNVQMGQKVSGGQTVIARFA